MASYQETQTLHRWWILLISLLPMIILAFVGIAVRHEHQKLMTILYVFPLTLLLCLIFIFLKFNLLINENGISYNVSIFFKIYQRKILWNDVQSIEICPLNKLREFGGFGIRYNVANGFWGIIFQGDDGIKILKNDESKIEISVTDKNKASVIVSKYFTEINSV